MDLDNYSLHCRFPQKSSAQFASTIINSCITLQWNFVLQLNSRLTCFWLFYICYLHLHVIYSFTLHSPFSFSPYKNVPPVSSVPCCPSDAPGSLWAGLKQLVWNVTHTGHLRTDIQAFRPGSGLPPRRGEKHIDATSPLGKKILFETVPNQVSLLHFWSNSLSLRRYLSSGLNNQPCWVASACIAYETLWRTGKLSETVWQAKPGTCSGRFDIVNCKAPLSSFQTIGEPRIVSAFLSKGQSAKVRYEITSATLWLGWRFIMAQKRKLYFNSWLWPRSTKLFYVKRKTLCGGKGPCSYFLVSLFVTGGCNHKLLQRGWRSSCFKAKDTAALNYSSSLANWSIATDSFLEKQMSRHV